MPLAAGNSNAVKSANIKELMAMGKYPQKQAVAIALNNARRHPRASGGQNYPAMPPSMFPPLSQAQVAAALPRNATTPMAGQKPPPAPPNRIPQFNARNLPPMPGQKPMYGGYKSGGRPGYAGGGITVANSPVSAPTASFPGMSAATPLAPVSTTPQPFSSAVANVPMSALSGGVGSNGIIAPTNNQGIVAGMPSAPTTTVSSPLASNPANPNLNTVAPSQSNSPPASGYYGLQNGNYIPLGTTQNGVEYLTNDPFKNTSYQPISSATSPITPDSSFYSYTTPPGAGDTVNFSTINTPYSGNIYTQGSNGQYSLFSKGGGIPQFKRAMGGGFPSASEADPWYMRADARDMLHTGGLFGGTSPGRADKLPVSVMTDSHIIPADVLSGLGDGNTLAGAHVMDMITHSGPYGIPLQRGPGTRTLPLPRAPRPMESTGGRREDHGRKTVPIAASSGEYNVSPEAVYRIGLQAAQNQKLDPKKLTPRHIMDLAHDILDEFILHVRKKTIAKMKTLKPPAKD